MSTPDPTASPIPSFAWRPPTLCANSRRTFSFATAHAPSASPTPLGRRGGTRYDREALYLSSLLHDLGLLDRFQGGQRFEVEGADHARDFLRAHGAGDALAELVWDAVALHTSVGIVNRDRRPEVVLTAFGTALDISGVGAGQIEAREIERIVAEWPREGFKEGILPLILEHVRTHPRQVTFTWMAEVGHAHLPGFACPSFAAILARNPLPD